MDGALFAHKIACPVLRFNCGKQPCLNFSLDRILILKSLNSIPFLVSEKKL